jgi:TP901 family phage tail tape measure protein
MALEFNQDSLRVLDQVYSKVEKINQAISGMGRQSVSTPFKEIKGEVIDLQTKINQMMRSIERVNIPNVSNLGKLKQTGLEIQGMTGDWVKFSQTYQAEGNKILKVSGALNTKTDELITSNAKLTNGLQDNKRATITWSEAINTAFTRLIQWQVATVALFGALRMLKQGFQDMMEIEAQSVNIMKVLNGTEFQKKQQGGLLDKAAIGLAKEYGQSIIDVQKAMQSWSRSFKDTDSIVKMTRASLLAATATDITFEGSVKHLSAIMAEWGMKTDQVTHCVDVLNSVSNKYRVTAEDVAEGLSKAGSGAKVAGMSFEELTGVITTGIQTLGQSGSEIATMWSRTMSRIAGNKGAKEAFEGLGIETNQSVSKMLNDLALKWDGMTNAEKRNFAITVAGTHHWSRFIGIFDNWNTVLQATADSYFSFNSAQSEVNLMMSTTQKKIAQLNASWQEFIAKNMAVLGATKGIASVLQTMVNGMSATPPAILQVVAALAIAIPTIIKFTVTIKAAQKAVADTGSEVTLFKVAAKLLSNPITALITILAVLAGAFIAVGVASKGVQNHIDKMNTEIDSMLTNKDKFNSYSDGVDNLSKKYYALSAALSHAQVGTKEYKGLQEKLSIVSKSLINVMDEFGIKTSNLGSDYTKLAGKIKELRGEIAKQRLTQLTSLRAKLAFDKAELISERDKLQKMLDLNKEYNEKKGYSTQYISGNILKEDIWNQKNKGFFEKFWERYFMFPFNNKGLQKKWKKEMGSLSTNITDIGSKELETALSIAEGKLQSLVDDSDYDNSKTEKKKKQISAFYTDLSRIQIEWINKLASNLDKAHGLEQETFKVLFTNGDHDFTLKTSSETKSLLEGLIKDWESYGKEAQSVIKGVSDAMLDANIAMAQSASNAAQEWNDLIGKMKNIPDALKDTLGVGDFYSKRQKEYNDISGNLSKQQDNLLTKINETNELISTNKAIANNRNASQADKEIAQANVENYKKVLMQKCLFPQ